uniref:Zinc finger protein n=1 Tax=Siphoviridae sp. ctbvd11 TaxID=2825567 RepID=A0A8S5QEH4_9CAUD|nr:MAG TPA: zinc finger protein [Siphoviridae sp. ctbvd11]
MKRGSLFLSADFKSAGTPNGHNFFLVPFCDQAHHLVGF